jgi:hypothetical protein
VSRFARTMTVTSPAFAFTRRRTTRARTSSTCGLLQEHYWDRRLSRVKAPQAGSKCYLLRPSQWSPTRPTSRLTLRRPAITQMMPTSSRLREWTTLHCTHWLMVSMGPTEFSSPPRVAASPRQRVSPTATGWTLSTPILRATALSVPSVDPADRGQP